MSGINGVEWDAVELPSQFMENFCWEWDVLRHMTSHVDTGEPLPRALFDKMTAAKNFQSGLQTLRQIELSLFDMLLHTEYQAAAAPAGGVLDVATGRRYRENVLEPGSSRSTLEGFKAFRGREPRIDALLRHQGLN